MAKSSIKGITIKIGGDTTGLDKALKETNKKSRELESELKAVDKALKLDPNNVTLVKQKQDLLKDSIKETKSKLDVLKEAQSQVTAQYKKGEIDAGQYRAFQRELETTKSKLSSLKDEKKNVNAIGTAFKKAKDKVEPVIKKVEKVGSAIGGAASKAVKFTATLGKIDTAMIGKAADGFKKYTQTIGVGLAAVTTALAANVETSREWNSDMTKLKTNAETSGNNFDFMKSKMQDLVAITGESDSSIEALSNLMAVGFSDEQMTPAINALSGAVEKFPDTLKIESLSDSLQETLATGAATGQFSELIGRMGDSVDDFNAGLQNCTSEAERQQYALDWLANSGLSEINDEYQSANKSTLDYERASFELQDALASLGTAFTPVMAGAKGMAADFLTKSLPAVQKLSGGFTKLFDGVSSLLDAYDSGGLDGLTEQIPVVISGLFSSASETLAENAPTLITAATTVLTSIIQSLAQSAPSLINSILPSLLNGFFGLINALVSTIPTLVPELVQGAITLFLGLIDGLNDVIGQLMPMLPSLIKQITDTLIENLPAIIEGGFQLLTGLITGLTKCTPDLINAIIALIPVITDSLTENLPVLVKAGMELIVALAQGLPTAIPAIIDALPDIISAIIDGFKEVDWLDLGANILKGILNGLVSAVSGIWSVVEDVGSAIIDGFCDFFDIHSPSRVMAKKVGQYLPSGIAVGMEDTADEPVNEAQAIVDSVAGVSAEMDPVMIGRQNARKTADKISTEADSTTSNGKSGDLTVVMNIDGKRFATVTAPYMDVAMAEKINLNARRAAENV
ncbi:phage tail protein [Ruminococcus sp.]|uniref:phage tail protein n=2 Tax=Ruminococcus sp. TaxID=41978 RepID=UPI003AF01F4F